MILEPADITLDTPHDALVAAIPRTYFSGHLRECDLSPYELCALLCLNASEEQRGPLLTETLIRLQHPPIPVEATRPEPFSSHKIRDCDRLRDACLALLSDMSDGTLEIAENLLDAFQNDGYHDGSITEGPWLAARDLIQSVKDLIRARNRFLAV